MTKINNTPNFNPFSGNLEEFIQASIEKAIHNLQTCIPAKIDKVISRNRVIATPAVRQQDSNWNAVQWAGIKLPVFTPLGSNITISLPLTVGDTGWIIAADLDPTIFLKNTDRPVLQNVFNRHQYQFGFFLPDKIIDLPDNADDKDALIISTADGTKITVKNGSISINSKTELNIKSETVKIDGNTKILLNGKNWAEHTHTVPQGQNVQVEPKTGSGTTTGTIRTGGVD